MTRLESLLSRLQQFYGLLPSPPRDPFAIFLWEALSMHTTPARRDAAFGALKRLRILTPDAMWRAPQKNLAEAVALAGPHQEQRLRTLRNGVALFRRSPTLPAVIRGPLIAARRALRPFPHLGEAYPRADAAVRRRPVCARRRCSRVPRRPSSGVRYGLRRRPEVDPVRSTSAQSGTGAQPRWFSSSQRLSIAPRAGDVHRARSALSRMSAVTRLPRRPDTSRGSKI